MPFEVVGPIESIAVIASGHGMRDRQRLRARHGGRHWRKLKGIAVIRIEDGRLYEAGLHWYEAQRLPAPG